MKHGEVLLALVQLPCGAYVLVDRDGFVAKATQPELLAVPAKIFLGELPVGPKIVEAELIPA